ncbi:RidA family protein [Paracoccus tegillarcae]|uniref:RidA family protein n=1 Tax=Paracoccus tegillarcae TaxID=1529068 RepID=A0A2K9EUS8_9RHOB|nr:RidA family protein [Paracoccus tegillarcae]AUH34616.1 hypothetical protein CUV01_15585 [Paracoccus tegillarcae]
MIRRISSAGLYEQKAGYCRAVVAQGMVHVSGTTAQGEEIPTDVVAQCQSALETIGNALAQAGSGFDQVIRVTDMLPDRRDFPLCWPLLAQTFGDNPPAATMIECGLIDPRYRIEIEVTALVSR